MERSVDHVVIRLFETVNGLVEMLEQSGQRSDVNIPSLKAQCLDLMLDAIKAGATQLAGDEGLHERARKLADRIAAYQRSFVDVRLHLIDLAKDWRCAKCGSDVVSGAAIVSKSPLVAELICRACGTRTALTPRGASRVDELFGALVSPAWNPALNGFVTESARK